MDTYTLLELNEHIRQVLSLNFGGAIWISAEIANCNESRGHFFLELVQKDGDGLNVIAKAEAALWKNKALRLKRQKKMDVASFFKPGLEVLVEVQVEFHERYGLKLIIEDIDPAFSLGKLAVRRQEIIRELQALQLIGKNATLLLPPVLQRIAVISSETAAGYRDFRKHLQENPYGYDFKTQLFQASMQGEMVEPEIIRQLKNIDLRADQFDCVVIIRGGGARLDLLDFDKLELCKAVANFRLPVFTGIGHEIDESIMDMVAHRALKTPTAVADFLLQHNLLFETEIHNLAQHIATFSHHWKQEQVLRLQSVQQFISSHSQRALLRNQNQLTLILEKLKTSVKHKTKSAKREVDELEKNIQLLKPEMVFKRGFTFTTFDGEPLSKENLPRIGDSIKTYFSEGDIESTVNKKNE